MHTHTHVQRLPHRCEWAVARLSERFAAGPSLALVAIQKPLENVAALNDRLAASCAVVYALRDEEAIADLCEAALGECAELETAAARLQDAVASTSRSIAGCVSSAADEVIYDCCVVPW